VRTARWSWHRPAALVAALTLGVAGIAVAVFATQHRSPAETRQVSTASYTHARWRLCVDYPSAVSVPHASLTLCARWSFRRGVTTLIAVSGAFRDGSGVLVDPRLVFVVEPEGAGLNPRTEIGRWVSSQVVGNGVRSDLTGWLPGSRLGGGIASQPGSWRLPDPWLSVEAWTINARGAVVLAGSEGIDLTTNGE
jgi:hypothetical protein